MISTTTLLQVERRELASRPYSDGNVTGTLGLYWCPDSPSSYLILEVREPGEEYSKVWGYVPFSKALDAFEHPVKWLY